MSITVPCTCGLMLNVPEGMKGHRVECSRCGAVVLVADPGQRAAPAGALSVPFARGTRLDRLAGALPPNFREPALTVGIWVFLPFAIIGTANGLGTSLVMMFFGGNHDFGNALVLGAMLLMSTTLMSGISSLVAVASTALVASRAATRLQAGATAAVASGLGMIVMFIIYAMFVLVSAAIFVSSGGGSSGGSSSGDASGIGTLIKISIATIIPAVFAGFATGYLFWAPRGAR